MSHSRATTAQSTRKQLSQHVDSLLACERCPDMHKPVVSGRPVPSRVMLLGQAPGPHEGRFGKPFAWTAGKTLFKWFEQTGIEEEQFREAIYMAAVCRCFPGKNPKGGDRVPTIHEIQNCSAWLAREVDLLRPNLVIPVGKLAITQIFPVKSLRDVIGQTFRVEVCQRRAVVIPLPHPSGASTWHRTEPGKTLLHRALSLISMNEDFQALLR